MLFAAAGFLIGSLDDLLVDVIWLCRSLWRRVFIYTRHEVMTLTNLPPARQPGVTAIFVPVWDEAGVIGAMLHHCLTSWTRSEEHTSELQSLMRISYAVFCLKIKN